MPSRLDRQSAVEFLAAVAPRMFGALWKANPVDFSTCTARELEMALNDLVEWGRGLPQSAIDELDRHLSGADLPTLTMMMDATLRKVRRILARGEIRSNDEFRLLSGLLSDVESVALSDEDKNAAEAILGRYKGGSNEDAL